MGAFKRLREGAVELGCLTIHAEKRPRLCHSATNRCCAEDAVVLTKKERSIRRLSCGAEAVSVAAPKEPAVLCIRKSAEEDVEAEYRLGAQVDVESGVRVATRMIDGQDVVIKRCSKRSFSKESSERKWRSTMERQLRLSKCDTMCDVMDVIETEDNYYIVMEKVHGTDLFEFATRRMPSHEDVRDVVRQILEALVVMHKAGCIHKDLKMENVMVHMAAKSPVPFARQVPCTKLIDFDCAEDWEPNWPKAQVVLGTDGYIAPEAYNGDYSPASDVLSVGVMMYALLTRRFPYDDDMFDDVPGENVVGNPAMARIYRRLQTHDIDFSRFPLYACEEAGGLCRSLLAFQASERPSAEEALEHPWFQLPRSSLPRR